MTLEENIRQVVRDELARSTPARPEPERLLNVEEACEALGGIARSTLYELIGRGDLHSLAIGRRRLIPRSAIGEFIRAGAST